MGLFTRANDVPVVQVFALSKVFIDTDSCKVLSQVNM